MTEHLVLRPLRRSDEGILFRQWNDPEVRRYLFDGEPVPRTLVRRQIAASVEGFRSVGCGCYLLMLRPRARVAAGFAGLRSFGDQGAIELLYALRPRYWGRGLATEASRAVLQLAFGELGVDEVFAGADPPNVASFRVMERLGMRPCWEAVVNGRPARYYRVGRDRFLSSAAAGRT